MSCKKNENQRVDIKIKKIFRDEKIFFSLEDGRKIGAPLKWLPKLYHVSEEELKDTSISPGGYGVLWNKAVNVISAYGMLYHNRGSNTISQ